MTQESIANAEIVKVDEDKRLVFGWASIIKDESGKILLDRQDDFIDSEDELEGAAYDYVLNSRDGGEMHVRRGVAKMVESIVFTEEKQRALGIPAGSMPTGWWIGFKVTDNSVWNQVKKGEYAGFSVHGSGKRETTELPLSKITEIGKADKKKPSTKKIKRVMTEFKEGKLKSSSGEVVTDPKQAIAIAISEQKRHNMKKILIDDMVTKSQMFNTELSKADKCAEALKTLLADTVSVYHEAHGFHWNVKGADFAQYHALFGDIYADLYGSVDPIAENILKLGEDAPFQLSQLIGLRTISETMPANDPQAMAMDLLDSINGLVETLNYAFECADEENQQGIANFVAERIDASQKWAWQLRSSVGIQKGDRPGHPFRGNQHTSSGPSAGQRIGARISQDRNKLHTTGTASQKNAYHAEFNRNSGEHVTVRHARGMKAAENVGFSTASGTRAGAGARSVGTSFASQKPHNRRTTNGRGRSKWERQNDPMGLNTGKRKAVKRGRKSPKKVGKRPNIKRGK